MPFSFTLVARAPTPGCCEMRSNPRGSSSLNASELLVCCQPPTGRLLYLPVGPKSDLDRQHSRFYGSRLRTSSASSKSPRSASAIASGSDVSSSWLKVKVRSSETSTVTTDPFRQGFAFNYDLAVDNLAFCNAHAEILAPCW